MGKDKRKTRLNKAEKGEFIGFSAFASPSSTFNATAGGAPTSKGGGVFLTPIYQGDQSEVSILFQRIGQKRDPTTKSKALAELTAYFQDDTQVKRSQVNALTHLLHLYQKKTHYDNAPNVRCEALICLTAAIHRVPKAFKVLITQQPDLIGMLYCPQMDSSADVREAAKKMWPAIVDALGTDDRQQSLDEGIWAYVDRIASYGKPKVMHDSLFANKAQGSLSEAQLEELGEKFERIVAAALDGFRSWIHQSNEVTAERNVQFIYKAMTNLRPSLRQKSYGILATMYQKPASKLLNHDKSEKLIAQSLSSEKEANCIPGLLEALLSYLAFLEKPSRQEKSRQFGKPMAKLFRRSCYGASTWQWAPSLLPLVASIGGLDTQTQLLLSVSEGAKDIVAASSQLEVTCAIAETAAFLLAKASPPPQSDDGEQDPNEKFGKSIAEVLLLCLSRALATKPTSSIQVIHQKVLSMCVKTLKRFQTISESTVFNLIREWFWQEALPGALGAKDQIDASLKLFLKELLKQQTSATNDGGDTDDDKQGTGTVLRGSLTAPLRTTFHGKLKAYSQSVPSIEDYNLLLIILNYSTVEAIFQGQNNDSNSNSNSNSGDGGHNEDDAKVTLQKFVMNDLLCWMIVHSSSISTSKNAAATKITFSIFGTVLQQSKDGDESWGVALRELLTAKCDIGMLCIGMRTMAATLKSSLDTLQCPELDQFCAKVGEDGDAHPVRDSDLEEFLALVVGLDHSDAAADVGDPAVAANDDAASLISADVIDTWIARCPATISPTWIPCNEAVLATLLQLVKSGRLENDHHTQVVLQAWRQGGSCWHTAATMLDHSSAIEQRSAVIDRMQTELQSFMEDVASAHVLYEDNPPAVTNWCERSIRFCKFVSKPQRAKPEKSILACIGIGDLNLWKTANSAGVGAESLLHCFMELMVRIEDKEQRIQLVEDVEDRTLILHQILYAASCGDTKLSATVLKQKHVDRFGEVIQLLGETARDGHDKDATAALSSSVPVSSSLHHGQAKEVLDICVRAIREQLENSNDASGDIQASKEVAMMARLSEMLYPRILPPKISGNAQAAQFQQGDLAWYLTTPDDETKRERVTIVKVHRDDQLKLYYTIAVTRDGASVEKQTVPDRLKLGTPEEEAEEAARAAAAKAKHEARQKEAIALSELIVGKMLKPNSDKLRPFQMELLSIATAFFGYGPRRGIGTLHHDAISLLSSAQQQILTTSRVESVQMDQLIVPLLKLSFAAGYGINCLASPHNMAVLGFDPLPSVRVIKEHWERGSDFSPEAASAVLMWLTLSFPREKTENVTAEGGSGPMLFSLASKLLKIENAGRSFGIQQYIALRAMRVGMDTMMVGNDAKQTAIEELIRAFSQSWNDSDDGDGGSDRGGNEGSAHDDQGDGNSDPLGDASNSAAGAAADNQAGLDTSIWGDLVRSVVREAMNFEKDALRNASRLCINDLVKCLFVAEKQSVSLQLLHFSFLEIPGPLASIEQVEYSDLTVQKLQEWSEGLPEDEVEDLKEDMATVSQWIPDGILIQIESWTKEDADPDDFIACSRMLLWLTLLEAVEAAARSDPANRQAIVSYIRRTQGLEHVLGWVLRYATALSQKNVKTDTTTAFDVDALARHPEACTLSELSELVLFRTTEVFPSLMKNWWEMDCPKPYVHRIKEFVIEHVSPKILERQMTRILIIAAHGELEVKGGVMSRQVEALYTQDDFKLSVSIRLPKAFPLLGAEVDCSKSYGVVESRWKRWSLMIKMMLNNQGRTLRDALVFWAQNVDQEFEGVEPCPICYSVLHVKSHKLPTLQCTTCSNRFHSDCLMQWFRSSGNSVCVMCQQPWNGTRVQ